MQLATWNVNSLKMRLQHVLDWLAANPVDFLCLQETKLTDDKFPKDEIEAAGYGVIFTGQPTYNGVALLYRKEAGYVPDGVQLNNPLHEDVQRRLVSARFQTAAGPVRAIGAAGARFPDTEEVTGSIPVSPTRFPALKLGFFYIILYCHGRSIHL